MSCTIHLFAHEGNKFAERLCTSRISVIRKVEAWATYRKIRGRTLDRGMKCVRQFCAADLPDPCGEDYFWALCWIGDALMERIKVPEFSELRSYSLIEQYGVVPGLVHHPGPYVLPRAKDSPPVAGFLPRAEMKNFQFQEVSDRHREARKQLESEVDQVFGQLGRQLAGKEISVPRDELSAEQVRFAQRQFLDVLETLVEDNLDLLAVVTG